MKEIAASLAKKIRNIYRTAYQEDINEIDPSQQRIQHHEDNHTTIDQEMSHAFDNDEFGQGCMMHALADTKSVQSIATVHAPTGMATTWLNSGSCGSKYGIRMERCKIMHTHL
jgi:cellobiose phosphorylase